MEKSIKICSGSIPLPQKFPGKRNAALSYGADYGIILYHEITLPVYESGNLVRKHMKHGLIVFLVSMVPLIELRGAIPYGVAYGMPLWLTYLIAIVGNMLPVPFIYLFARKILLWGKDKPVIGRFFTFCLEKGERGGQKLQAKAGRGLFWALLLFVGIPLPGTGAWTGTLAASLLDMGFKKSVLACMGGVPSVRRPSRLSRCRRRRNAPDVRWWNRHAGTCSSWRPSAAGRRRRTPKQPGSRRCGRFRQTVTPCGSGPGPRCLRR